MSLHILPGVLPMRLSRSFGRLAAKLVSGADNEVGWGMKDVPHQVFDLVPGERCSPCPASQTFHRNNSSGSRCS